MSLKSIALMLCTCTWIEIMTGVGVTLYLACLHEYRLAAISACLFSPLIGFHFAIDRSSGKTFNVGWNASRRIISLERLGAGSLPGMRRAERASKN